MSDQIDDVGRATHGQAAHVTLSRTCTPHLGASDDLRDPVEQQLVRLLDGQTVFTYATDRRSVRRFTKALKRRLILVPPG